MPLLGIYPVGKTLSAQRYSYKDGCALKHSDCKTVETIETFNGKKKVNNKPNNHTKEEYTTLKQVYIRKY